MAFNLTMERHHKPRSGIAHGGIGTGGLELRADGIFRNINIFNNYPFGTGSRYPYHEDSTLFFKVRWQEEGGNPKMKILQIEEGYEVGAIRSQPIYYIFPWMSGVDRIDYSVTFPFSKLVFSDDEMPFDIEMEVFSPFIPHDVKNSSLPGIFFNFEIKLKGNKKCDVLLMMSGRSAVGYDVEEKEYVTKTCNEGEILLCEMSCNHMKGDEPTFGTQTLASISKDSSYYVGWEHLHPYYEIVLRNSKLPNINDTEGRNQLDEEKGISIAQYRLFSTVGVSSTLSNRQTFKHTFIYAWNFPNLYAAHEEDISEYSKRRLEGYYYSNFFKNSNSVASYMANNYYMLEGRTRRFIKDFYNSSLDSFLLDQVNSHLNTFVCSSWLTKDMNFGVQEGLTDRREWGPLATTDVGMYGSIMVASLFPELDKQTQRAHMNLQKDSGEVMHGIQRNFKRSDDSETVKSRLDMPSQYVVQTLRGYFWTNDKAYLDETWASVKKALDYCLNERDYDKDFIPDMEGVMCSYDNFPMYGAASYIASQWLAALQFAIHAAKDLGDTEAFEKYTKAYKEAKKNAQAKLWNGSYFRLSNDKGGRFDIVDEGCLTDQIIGQWAVNMIGVDDIYDKNKIRKALSFIFNRSYSKEYGLVNCRWPEDGFLHKIDPDCWNDQANTCWTGVELGFASLLIYEGFVEEGLEVVRNVDQRYRKSGMYFDHAEFGGHYYRPMSSWGLINAMLGFSHRGNSYSFNPKMRGMSANMYFVTANGTSHFRCNSGYGTIELVQNTGEMIIEELKFKGKCLLSFENQVKLFYNCSKLSDYNFSFDKEDNTLTLTFDKGFTLNEGETLYINFN